MDYIKCEVDVVLEKEMLLSMWNFPPILLEILNFRSEDFLSTLHVTSVLADPKLA
jgi:hypothetical protein